MGHHRCHRFDGKCHVHREGLKSSLDYWPEDLCKSPKVQSTKANMNPSIDSEFKFQLNPKQKSNKRSKDSLKRCWLQSSIVTHMFWMLNPVFLDPYCCVFIYSFGRIKTNLFTFQAIKEYCQLNGRFLNLLFQFKHLIWWREEIKSCEFWVDAKSDVQNDLNSRRNF